MKKILTLLNIIGFIMMVCALCFIIKSKTVTDILFWTGVLLMIPNWIYDARTKALVGKIITAIAIIICAAVGYIFFTGTTIKLPGEEPITIVKDKENL